MKPVRLEVEHAKTGERKACEYVQTLAQRARAKALVLRWPTLGGQAMFCIASGWELQAQSWRLTADSRARARKLAKAEGLLLPPATGFPPRPRARTESEPKPQPVDPRQVRMPF